MECSPSREFSEMGFSSSRASMCDVLRSLIINNIEYFGQANTKTGRKFADYFQRFLVNLNDVEHQVNEITSFAYEYDYDRATPGNGYRSMVSVVDSCVEQSIKLCRSVCLKRSSFTFRRDSIAKEVESFCDLMGCLSVILHLPRRLRLLSEPHHLFPSTITSPVDLLLEAENIDTTCFYGRCLGFQFHDSLKKPLKFLSVMMASFSDAFYNTGGMVTRTVSSVISCGKYIYSPELRAERIVEVARKASVDFCKSFWLLQEHQLLQQVPGFVCVSLQLNKVIQVSVQSLKLEKTTGGLVDIPIPSSHLPSSPVICRLLSASIREGQISDEETFKYSRKIKPPSPYLIIQCHGGGFVAQSSKSHEVYLRDWAVNLDVPMLCIDYSLAPDAPYPRPLEECFYAYAWAIKNSHCLGSTCEKICFVGDSAGGNLLAGVIIKSIELGIRLPDGFMSMYTPFIISFLPSPSRLLCLMDPLLPFGFMMRCLRAYAGHSSIENGNLEEEDDLCHSESIGFASEVSDLSDSCMDNDDGSNKRQDQCESKKDFFGDGSKLNLSGSNILNGSGESDISSFEEVVASEVEITDFQSETNVTNDSECSKKDSINCKGECSQEKDKDYVSEFMDWYVLDSDELNANINTQSESVESDENVLFEMPVAFPFQIPNKMSNLTNRVMSKITGFFSNEKSKTVTTSQNLYKRKKSYNGIFADRNLDDSGSLVTLLEEFKKFTVSKDDPYLSPYYASDEILRKFPPVSFLTTALDPCLDDTICMSKKLRSLEVLVNVDILDHLPHGFLNLTLVSKDANDGANLAVKRIKSLLNISEDDEDDEIDEMVQNKGN